MKISIELLNIEDTESVHEYSDLIMEVMSEFNKEEMDGFQIWFASVEGVTSRKEWDDSGFETVQFIAKSNGSIIGVLEIANMNQIQSFFVKKGFQKHGIGRQLFNYSLKYFLENDIKIEHYGVLSSDYGNWIL